MPRHVRKGYKPRVLLSNPPVGRKIHAEDAKKAFENRAREIERQKQAAEKVVHSKAPFRIFEAGPGGNPKELVRKARKSAERGKNREFDAADPNVHRTEFLAGRRASAKRMFWIPKSLRLERKSAIEALKAKPDNHYHVIFGSYFLNNIKAQELAEFMTLAKEKLRPGGRMIFIQSVRQIEAFEKFAKSRGLKVMHRRLTDSEAVRGPRYVALRATPEGRQHYLNLPSLKFPHVAQGLMEKHGVKRVDELERPTLLIIRKPRTSQKS